MRLTVLGCAGTFPGPDSPCSSYLVEHEGFRLLLDMGNGAMSNLQRCGDVLDLDAVVISHLHGDHCLDLVTYTYARRYDPRGLPKRLPVHGPGALSGRLAHSFDAPQRPILDDVFDLRVTEPGVTEIGPFRVEQALVNHPVECYGIRLSAGGRSLTYSADTGSSAALVELARGTDLFLCEASFLDGADNPPDVHLTGAEAAEHARRAEVGRLMLTHLVPWNDTETVHQSAEAAFAGPVELARPCTEYDV